MGSAGDGRAVKIPGSIKGHAAVGRAAVAVAGEAVQHALCPASARWGELKHHSLSVRAAGRGRAVDVSGGIENQIAQLRSASIAAREVVDDGFGPRTFGGLTNRSWWSQVEDRAPSVAPAVAGCPVQSAVGTEDYSRCGLARQSRLEMYRGWSGPSPIPSATT